MLSAPDVPPMRKEEVRDRFDDWVQARDRRDEGLPATRYIPSEVTGYEELDQYGSWVDNAEYGTL